jgi:hypothetical protein
MISPLIIPLLLTRQADADRAERRIKQAQYCEAVEARAQHREIERVQPQSHLEPEYDRANRKSAADRLIAPEQIKRMAATSRNR